MSNGPIKKFPADDITKYFAKRNDLRSMAYVSDAELSQYVWVLDTNVFIEDEYYNKCLRIVNSSNFLISQDVIDELTRGTPVQKDAQWERARQLALVIQEKHNDKIFQKPEPQLEKELFRLSGLMTKPHVEKIILQNFQQIYDSFKKSWDKQQALDNFIIGIDKRLNDSLRRDFESRARGLIQPDKISHIIDFFLKNMKITLRNIFNTIMKYSSLDIENCKRFMIKHFFRPVDSDIRIAASYIEHHKPRHHLGSNDKDVVELIILHEYRMPA